MNNGVFGTGLTFTQLIISAIVFVGGIIAVKITFSLDLNKYLESRNEKHKAKAKNACLHFEFVPKSDNEIVVHSFFVSPSGTANYICQRCGLISLHLDQDSMQRTIDYYVKNIKDYNKQNKKFHKLLKKAGQV
jgi:hypothetical protein